MALSAVGSQRETTALPHTYQLLTSVGIPAEVDQSGGGSAERSELRREVGESLICRRRGALKMGWI